MTTRREQPVATPLTTVRRAVVTLTGDGCLVVKASTKRDGAPGELELVRAFINTADRERGRDDLAHPSDLRRWLVGRDLLAATGSVTEHELEVALAVREALRELAGGNAGRLPSRSACATLDALSEASGLRPHFEPDGTVALAPRSGGVAGGLGRLLGIVVASLGSGGWSRLKTCRNPACRWAFYDSTRNRSGVWCDMAVCGSRAKARAYYARTQGAGEH
jgi:predicted RNA-binding Zn ribbon-like protein